MANKKLIFENMPELPYSIEEAMNRLRINVGFLGDSVKKIMVVSSEPNEGKSFACLHLWRQMAESGIDCILVDADMRNSVLIEKYNLHTEDNKEFLGTSHYLSGSMKLDEVIYHTQFEHGDLLPNVDNIINPSMLIENKRFAEMLDELAEKYRYVLVDCPPLGMVSDGEQIGHLCDGAILTVRSGVTPKAQVRNSVAQLERSGCKVLGIVLNRVNANSGGYYHKYYGKKYYYGKGEYYGSKNK